MIQYNSQEQQKEGLIQKSIDRLALLGLIYIFPTAGAFIAADHLGENLPNKLRNYLAISSLVIGLSYGISVANLNQEALNSPTQFFHKVLMPNIPTLEENKRLEQRITY